jgi:hypothetical protein
VRRPGRGQQRPRGCFSVNIYKSSASKHGFQVSLKFTLTQHSRDELLLKSLVDYLGCGRINQRSGKGVDFVAVLRKKFSDIENKISLLRTPFFKDYPIIGVKFKDFED